MQMEGIVVFRLTGMGTRSEGIRPFLYLGNAIFQKIWLQGDTSFNGIALMTYDSKHVVVEGETNEYDIFTIKTIEEIVITDSELNYKNKNISTEEQNL